MVTYIPTHSTTSSTSNLSDRNAYNREWKREKRLKEGIPVRITFATEEERKAHHAAKRVEWRKKNKKAHTQYAIEWNRNHQEQRAKIAKLWKQTDQGKLSQQRYKKRRRRAEALPPWADQSAIDYIYAGATAMGLSVDHIIPLVHPKVCGLHTEANLFVMPFEDNLRKGNRYWPGKSC